MPPRLSLATLLQDSAGEPLYKLFKAIKHQVEKGPVDAVQKKAKYTLNDTGLLGDDVEYAPLVSPGAGCAVGSAVAGSRVGLGSVPGSGWEPDTWAHLPSGRGPRTSGPDIGLAERSECSSPEPAASRAPARAGHRRVWGSGTGRVSVVSTCAHVRGSTCCVSCE